MKPPLADQAPCKGQALGTVMIPGCEDDLIAPPFK